MNKKRNQAGFTHKTRVINKEVVDNNKNQKRNANPILFQVKQIIKLAAISNQPLSIAGIFKVN